ncbi:flagellar hook-basal body protein [Cupriavidus sp. 30B13]|uniref:flagellar hook-basal body protein n=1 Tax=Cupriavidus sp. 30B13 TaxID=3384241 RepID=UPI003B91F575
MQQTLGVALLGMQQDASQLDRIAMNLANAASPGYRRDVGAMQSTQVLFNALPFAAHLAMGDGATTGAYTSGRQAALTPLSLTDTRAGTLRATGQKLDVALTGQEFFEVATEAGPAYTRDGQFRLDVRGRLVTANGNAVMGRGGEIVLTTSTPIIDSTGVVRENGNVVAQLKLVTFADPKALKRLGDGMWEQGAGMTLVQEGATVVRQGFLENSNVNSLAEMTELIRTMRHFESMQKVTQHYDEMTGNAIRKLGEM